MSMEIYKQAIEIWGHEAQTEMLVEECSEVIMAIQKLKREYRSNGEKLLKRTENVCEELADLSIMLEQMMFVFDPELINQFKVKKIERLQGRLESAVSKNKV